MRTADLAVEPKPTAEPVPCRPAAALQRDRISFQTSDSERTRSLEIAKFFSASSIVPHALQPPLDAPQPSQDLNLTAIAQLGVYKLECERSFVSLIDRSTQYIVGEATRSTPLTPHALAQAPTDPNGALYLGFRALDLTFGVCPQTMQVFTTDDLTIDTLNIRADSTCYVIRDFCAHEHFKTRPYVTGWPHMRSYAEVPLKSTAGFVIGSYCVVDTKPRSFDDQELHMLAEIAGLVTKHLELLRSEQERERLQGLVRGVSSFAAGPSIPAIATSRPASVLTEIRLEKPRSHASKSKSPAHDDESDLSPEVDLDRDRHTSPEASQSTEDIESPLTLRSRPRHRRGSLSTSQAGERDSESSTTPKAVRATFMRAAKVIRNAMDLRGVSFINPTRTKAKTTVGSLTHSSRSLSLSTGDSSAEKATSICPTQGYATKTADGHASGPISISEVVVQRILKQYPFGHVFSFDDLGMIVNSVGDSDRSAQYHPSQIEYPDFQDDADEPIDTGELLDAMENAHSVIVLPMWNYQESKWFTLAVGWTTDPSRILDIGDLNYLSAFGNSVMAEMSRLGTEALSQAKSDFISSVSHELRSPLHGVLAGTELLRRSSMSRAEHSMLDTIDSCGHMLLDTINHVLDYAQINNFHRTWSSGVENIEQNTEDNAERRLAVIDLASLVQDVVENAYLGQTWEPLKPNEDPQDSLNEEQSEQVTVVIHIDPEADFTVRTEKTAVSRIIMNLVSNSLKYTRKGSIEVSLNIKDCQAVATTPAKHICFQVRDSGQGISPEFLQHHIFTAFAQEDSLSAGMGLGLSLARRLIDTLDGTIHIESEKGVGTLVRVEIPIGPQCQMVTSTENTMQSMASALKDTAQRLRGFAINFLPASQTESASHVNGSDRSFAREYIRTTARQWFGMDPEAALDNPVDSMTQDSPRASFYISSKPASSSGGGWTIRATMPESAVDQDTRDGESKVLCAELRQPLCPRRLAAALMHALDLETVPDVVDQDSDPKEVVPLNNLQHAPIPLKAAQQKAPQADDLPTPPASSGTEILPSISPSPDHRPPHLLLVDDNAINLKLLSTCVARVNCTYTTAANGQEAVEAYRNARFDLIFMDLSMPVMDGYTATSKIREYDREMCHSRTRIYALTALGAENARERAFASGVDFFLAKPAKMKEIAAILKSLNELDRGEAGEETAAAAVPKGVNM